MAAVKKVARMLKRHLDRLLAYFRHWITNAATEGFNSRIQAIKAAARGFRNFEHYRIRICSSVAAWGCDPFRPTKTPEEPNFPTVRQIRSNYELQLMRVCRRS